PRRPHAEARLRERVVADRRPDRVVSPPPSFRVVVITNRRLLGGDALLARLAAILAAAPRGSVLVQVREKDLDGGPLLRLTRDVLAVARPAGAPVWVNDRVDVALAA